MSLHKTSHTYSLFTQVSYIFYQLYKRIKLLIVKIRHSFANL